MASTGAREASPEDIPIAIDLDATIREAQRPSGTAFPTAGRAPSVIRLR